MFWQWFFNFAPYMFILCVQSGPQIQMSFRNIGLINGHVANFLMQTL